MNKKLIKWALVFYLVLSLGLAGTIGDITDLIENMFQNDIIGVDEENQILYGFALLFVIFFLAVVFSGGDIIFVFFIMFMSIESLAIFGFIPLWMGIFTAIMVALVVGIAFISRLLGQ